MVSSRRNCNGGPVVVVKKRPCSAAVGVGEACGFWVYGGATSSVVDIIGLSTPGLAYYEVGHRWDWGEVVGEALVSRDSSLRWKDLEAHRLSAAPCWLAGTGARSRLTGDQSVGGVGALRVVGGDVLSSITRSRSMYPRRI